MKKLSMFVLVLALAFAAVGVAFVSRPAQAAPSGSESAAQSFQVTATPGPDDSATAVGSTEAVSMVELWDQFCVRKIPYTILALPEGATYLVVAPYGPAPAFEHGATNPNVYACSTALTFNGKQIVVCTGPNAYSFSLQVTSDGATEDFSVPLKACPLKKEPRE